ncbi:PstS family phosphate ABC transporter substrate-binding protein [Kiloniella laminariae]|uniref:PstS family phosphate ABC transporter substrate-binding protein n=1 Tax=Kiloniella laminariae TaxID=454162 RepID=A0ABT4LJL3_9PROT|nr:PstS family phosphate ABC transporter substrate-binding protein [Kiloniella laminariae]MCZ4281267.1 PstS family phosphate ABC transporter substrate-binding protein [Kiloniella laminariae]
MNVIKKVLTATALAGMMVAIAGAAQARDQIRIVGSSTVFPFSTTVAETFGKTTGFKTPVVESTGSGGGMKLFCAGVGVEHPDITNASRRIKSSEYEDCTKNGVSITEVKIGFDGIVLANSKASERFELTLQQVFMALAKQVPVDGKLVDNPYQKWSDIDPSLPDSKIEVLGPPPTSGTRDAFVELAMEGGAKKFDSLADLRKSDKKAFAAVAHTIREDGAYIEAGENDNLIIQKLEANPKALGIFGFSFLDQNADKIQGSIIEQTEPTFDNIASGDYGVSRSLYFYVKKEHVGSVPGIAEFVKAFTSEDAWGDEGYLADKGLIPLPAKERDIIGNAAQGLEQLSM